MSQDRGSSKKPHVSVCGRRDVLEFILNTLASPRNRLIVLSGARLDGKTSLLRWLARVFPDGYTAIYVNPVTWPPLLPNEVMPFIAKAVAQSLRLQRSEASTFSTEYIREADELLSSRRLVVLLDELPTESLGEQGGSRRLIEELRAVMERWPKMCAVIGLPARLHELDGSYLESLQDARVRYLSPVYGDDVLMMAEGAGVHLDEGALDRLEQLTGGHPALLSWLCGSLSEYIRWRGLQTVTASDVDLVLSKAGASEDVGLVRMWQSLDLAERLLLIVMAHSQGDSVESQALQRALAARGVRLAGIELPAALDRLAEMGLLVRDSHNDYTFGLEAFRRWVRLRFPLTKLREALEKMNPRASEEFEAARDQHSRGKTQDAIALYRKALDINPNHFSSWLGLGQALLERGFQSEAIEALERAYELDSVPSRDSLAAALLSHARALQSQGADEAAARVYGRLLAVSPGSEPARQNLLLILGQRAEAFAQRGDLERARVMFRRMLEVEPGDESVTARLEELSDQRRIPAGVFDGTHASWGRREWRTLVGLGLGLCVVVVALFAFSRRSSFPVEVPVTTTPSPESTAIAMSDPAVATDTPVALITATAQPVEVSLGPENVLISETATLPATNTPVPPTETSTPTEAPTSTATRRPTSTPRPATPTPLVVETETPTPTGTHTATPTPAYARPSLVEPAHGAYFSGPQTRFELRWNSVGPLAADEWYGLSVRYQHNGQHVETGAWLKETKWIVPEYLAGQADEPDRKYQWDVVVVKELETKPDGSRAGREISPRSETRSFVWR